MGNNGNQGAGAKSSDQPQQDNDGSTSGLLPPTDDPMNVDLEDDPPPANSLPVWDPTRLRRATTAIAIVQSQTVPREAPIPSPLATLGRRETELAGMVSDMAVGVQDLWHLCANTRRTPGEDNIRDEIDRGRRGKKRSHLLSDANVGLVAWIARAYTPKPDDLLVSDDESGDDDGSPETETLRYHWIGSRTRISLEAFGANTDRAHSEQPSGVLNIFFSERKDGEAGHFIIPPSQSVLTVNGIRVPTGAKAAGPLPSFAVIEIGEVAAFWWRDPQGLDYLPQGPTTNSRKRVRGLNPEEEFENFNDDEVPFAKKPKVLENPSRLGTVRRSARIASLKAVSSAARTASSGLGPHKVRHVNDLPPRPPRSPEVGPRLGPLQRPLPRSPPIGPEIGEQPGPRLPRTEKPPKETRDVQPPSSPSSPMTWDEQLRDRLEFWRDEAQRAGNSENPHQILNYNNLDDNDVISAIASVWRPLIDWGTSYAFGSAYLFQIARVKADSGGPGHHSPNPLIIPLIFNNSLPQIPSETFGYSKPPPDRKAVEDPEAAKLNESNRELAAKVNQTPKNPGAQKEAPKPKTKTTEEKKEVEERIREHERQSSVGHFVLAVAERVPSRCNRVRLRFWDSSPRAVGKGIIRAHARQIVRNSGWMPPYVWPEFGEEDWASSPKQCENSCGLHVVFSAWAYMLSIPINPGDPIKGIQMSPRFYGPALEIVNLALRGMMDATTVRAFMHVHQYAAPRPFGEVQKEEMSIMPDERRQMPHLNQTAVMNEDMLNRTIDQLQVFEAIQSEARRKERGPGPRPPGHKSPKRPTPRGPTDRPSPQGGFKQEPTGPKAGSSLLKGRKSPLPKVTSSTKEESFGSKWRELLQEGLMRHYDSARKEDDQKKAEEAKELLKEAEEAKEAKKKSRESKEATKKWEQEKEKRKEDTDLKKLVKDRSLSHFLEESGSGALNDEQVCCAIASIWDGLRVGTVDRQPRFAFGAPVAFQVNRESACATGVVGNPYPLIIPILFNSGKYTAQVAKSRTEEVGSIGHFVLGIAERMGNNVRLILMDSSPGSVPRRTIRATARGLVRYTGWMGQDERGMALPATPKFESEIDQLVPTQRLNNNCGFHVIINAWAHMLGIPIYSRKERTRDDTAFRGGAEHDKEFYTVGKAIVNLAMRGLMDSTTIQAFLIVYGYSELQDSKDQESSIRTVIAQRMNLEILRDIIDDLRAEEATAIALANSIGQQ